MSTKLATALIRWRVAQPRQDEVLDDIEEVYALDIERVGKGRAQLLYWGHALNIALFGIGKPDDEPAYETANPIDMYRNYLKVALRTIHRQKAYTLINVLGLAVGLACVLLILEYVQFEQSYDNVADAERIYRVQNNYIRNNILIYESAATFSGVAPAMKAAFPEVEATTRFYHAGAIFNTVVSNEASAEPQHFREPHLIFGDEGLFDLFAINLVEGDAATALDAVNTMVLSAATAQRYFGKSNPIGQTLRVTDENGNNHLCTVTGVFADQPMNRHVAIELIVSYPTLHTRPEGARRYEENWGGYAFYTYVRLAKGTDPRWVEQQMYGVLDQYKPGYKEVNAAGERIRQNHFTLVPLGNIHLTSHLQNEAGVNGNATLVSFLLLIAAFTLIIAWVNYINLSTARALERAKEVGLRKVLGSRRGQLVRQFLLEATVLHVIAVGCGLLLVWMVRPAFLVWAGIPAGTAFWNDVQIWTGLLAFTTLGAVLAGLYPAFVLSGFRPATVLKGSFRHSARGQWLRKSLVTFQFALSIALIIGTVAVYAQLAFMQNRDLGFDVEQTVILEKPGNLGSTRAAYRERMGAFKQSVRNLAAVRQVAASSVVPSQGIHRGIVVTRQPNSPLSEAHSIEIVSTDYDFLEAYGMTMLAGRGFSEAAGDTSVFILNASAATMLGFASPEVAVGETVYLYGQEPRRVVGVMADYHHESLQRAPDPMLFNLYPSVDAFLSIKLSTQDLPGALAQLEALYQEAFPGNPFRYTFLDDRFNAQYTADQRFGERFRFFAMLAIFIACLGLSGLTAFATQQRAKEIGIRKVCGASVGRVLVLLASDILKLVLVAATVAFPIAYISLDGWLNTYAFRIALTPMLFLMPLVGVIALALLTMSFQSLRAALSNPIVALRQE